ncbi:type I restriction enzyme, S subunit [Gammaproteobacteria bacterium]
MSSNLETVISDLPSDWNMLTVSNLIDEGILERPMDGNHGGKHPKGSDYVIEGIPFVMATDINNGKIDYANCKYISKNLADSLDKGFAHVGDVLLTHKASLGRTAIVGTISSPYIMLTPQVTYYRVRDRERLNNSFLKYYFDSPFFQDTLVNHGDSGSTRAYVGITAQKELPILLPPLPEQRAIAAVLYSLDDKIDLLHRQNKTLEAMAETLFRQWFVVEADEGWEEGKLELIMKLSNGKSRPNSSGLIPVYGGNGILDYTDQSNYEDESIIIGRVGAYCGSLFFENNKIWVSDNALHAKARNDQENYFLFYLLKTLDLNSFAEGSSHPLLTQTLLNSIDITIPPAERRQEFNTLSKILNSKTISNQIQIRTLESLRDTLLPKLMSGEVRIKCQ